MNAPDRIKVVPSVDKIAAELCRSRAERIMAGTPVRVKHDAEALHAWLAARSRRRATFSLGAAAAVCAVALSCLALALAGEGNGDA